MVFIISSYILESMEEHFTTSVDEQNIVHMVIKGTIKKDEIPELKEWVGKTAATIKEVHEKTGSKVKATLDLSGLSSEYDGEAISILASFAKTNEPHIDKTATFGGSWVISFAENIVIALSGRENIKTFKNEEEAMKWLAS